MKSEITPPRLADKIFLWYCKRAAIEDMHGDVVELFYQDIECHSLRKARLLYWKRIFALLFSYAIRRRKNMSAYHVLSSDTISLLMLKNYFKTASRNLARHKFFTTLNVFGLALGMSITLVFIAMLSFIYTYDDFHTKGEDIYRVTTQLVDRDQNPHYASAPVGLIEKLKEDFSGIEKAVPVQSSLRGDATYLGKKIRLNGYFTTSDFFSVFDFPLLRGNAASALSNPNTMVITEAAAAKFFGSNEPVGEIIRFEPYGDFVITGILKDVPKNSHMHFEALASHATWMSYTGRGFLESETAWKEFINSYVYVLLSKNISPSGVENHLKRIADQKYIAQHRVTASFRLQPLSKIVPGADLENQLDVSWSFFGIMMFASMALIILVPACVNYVNLSISHSLNRMKEIGVRKVMGGQKRQIFFQFIMETTLTMLIALMLSYFIFDRIRTEFLQMIGRTNTLELTPTLTTVSYFILFALLMGFFAGAVPAIYFSKITPVTALKGKPEITTGHMRFPMRKIMITAQFVLSLGFIMGLVIMLQQYRYSVNFDFGFQRQQLLDIELQGVDPRIVKNEFEKLSSVQRVSMSSHIPGVGYTPARYVMTRDRLDSIETATISIDEDFIPNMGLTLLAGKNFSDQPSANARTIIVNEEFVKKLRITDPRAAVDETLVLADGSEVHIGGVVKNFHYANLRTPIESFFFDYDPRHFEYANIAMAAGTGFEDVHNMETVWRTIGGESKFTAHFLSDELTDAYRFYLDFVKLFGFLGLLAITVACLGLLGTVVFIVRNRRKEVSIRKVMGASVEDLTVMLSKDFIMLMVIASFITVPAMYLVFQHVLLASIQRYNVKIGFSEIAISLLIMMGLALTTILSQTLKAARANPGDNLRNE